MTVPERHQLSIARSTLRLSCAGAIVMGGPNHLEAITTIELLTGERPERDAKCLCVEQREDS